ncbi:zinc metalloprotease [Spiroplasma syrphidicola EA-1]|uniref:Zinc metalloprotease n=1 Tax=Spiroplasma syrphidicola EA-1 TaxID=1276229 RepID=R4UM18_9MOLU|nr:SprT family zinc-dependent metalloprotease [Spiroplasma syrphidicola]AGM26276.1 zinc metalloprotease [Spiroplasma syrphidicola EA-1]
MAMAKYLSYQGTTIPYYLTIKKQKNIVLNVSSGEIKISAPAHAQDWEIEMLLYKNIKKILSVVNDHNNYRKIYWNQAGTGYLILFDQKYPLQLTSDNVYSKIIDHEAFLIKTAGSEEENIKRIHTFLKQKFYYKFEQLLNKWAKIMDLEYKNLTVKSMKRKWGVCYPESKKIVLNIKLIHFDPSVLEYVIVHELSHLVHHNHSKAFWHYVEKYFPTYREKMNILKRPGI